MIGFLILWPLFASLVLFVWRPRKAGYIALVASGIELAASGVLAWLTKGQGTQYIIDVPWVSSLGIDFFVGVDGISLLMVLLTTFLVPFIILSSFSKTFDKPHTFYALILLMQMALVGVFVARDGFLFYIFWEVALLPIYFICLIWGGVNRARITLKFFIYTLAGSLFMLVGIIFIYLHMPDVSRNFHLSNLYHTAHALPANKQGFVFWLLFVAFAIKMPIFPLHTWQPDTYAVAPTQGTMLLSGIMLKMGIFGMIRWLIPMVPIGVKTFGSLAIVLSVIGIVYASVIALAQKDYKRLIAYSSIAHVGLIAAGALTLSKIGLQGAIIQMMSHGLVVFALFYIVDIMEERTGTRQIADLGGIRNVAPRFATVFVIVMLGSVALPFTSGFVGEFLLINSLVQYKLVIGAVAGVTTILGAVYMFKAFQGSVLGETNSVTAAFSDLTAREKTVLYPIVALIVLIGVYPGPLLEISESAVNNLLMIAREVIAPIK